MLALIIRMYASCRKELPDGDLLDAEVNLAMEDLKEIPDSALSGAFQEALASGGGFLPGNGLIVKCWRSQRGNNHEEALRAIRIANTKRYLNIPPPETKEEIPMKELDPAERDAMLESLRKALGGE